MPKKEKVEKPIVWSPSLKDSIAFFGLAHQSGCQTVFFPFSLQLNLGSSKTSELFFCHFFSIKNRNLKDQPYVAFQIKVAVSTQVLTLKFLGHRKVAKILKDGRGFYHQQGIFYNFTK